MAAQKEQFIALFPQLVREVLSSEKDNPQKAEHVSAAIEHLEKVTIADAPVPVVSFYKCSFYSCVYVYFH